MRNSMISHYPKMTVSAIVLIAVGMGLAMSKILSGIPVMIIGISIFFIVFKKFTKPLKNIKRCHPSH